MKKTSMGDHIHHIDSKNNGYTLVGVLLILCLFNVCFLVCNKMWLALDQRDKEKELTFNMIALQRGINLYKEKMGNYPENISVLYDLKLIRKEYENPFRLPQEISWVYNKLTGEMKANTTQKSIDGSKYENWKIKVRNNKYYLIKN